MDNPSADRTLKNWIPAGAGFLAAAIVIAWLSPGPPRAVSLKAVLFIYALALAYTLLILGVTAAAAFLAWLAIHLVHTKHPPPRITWRIASRAVWFLPLYLFAAAKSGWAIVAAVLLTLGIVHVLRNLQPASQRRTALSSGWKIFSCVVAGAAIEGAIVATGIERIRPAIPIVAAATLIVAWHATKSGRSGHPSRGLVTLFAALVLTCGALVRRVGIAPGDGLFGNPVDPAISASLYALQKSFGGGPATPFAPNKMEASDRKGDENVNVPGMPHRGIILWPDVKKETTLVPPLLTLGRKALKNRKQTLTIPFYGAYWFYRPPYLQPPFDSLVLHGSPAIHSFLSNDGSPLTEEAHQDLQTNLDLSWCSRIELDVQNADHRPELLDIELLIVDRTHWKDTQSLGRMPLASRPRETAVPETILYPMSPTARAKNIVEFIVRFHLLPPRGQESAQVELERFRLVPKAGR
ncbi:MAG TPA: hypothetical protein VGL53_31180 [Bryobacteraceae bacterium]